MGKMTHYSGDFFHVYDFGAVGDGVTDDTAAIQAAVNAAKYNGNVLIPRTVGTGFRTTAPIELPGYGYRVRIYSDGFGNILADHAGDAIQWISDGVEQGHNVLERINIYGPNVLYPPDGADGVSQGAGLRMDKSYYGVVRDCEIRGFKYGVHLTRGVRNTFTGATYLRLNDYGIYIDGGAANMNNFQGISVRENQRAGLWINGTGPNFPTHNVFDSCLFESNNKYPYRDLENYPPDAPNNSVGIRLTKSFDNRFNSCYSENHQYAIWLEGSSDYNQFNGHRFSDGWAGEDRVMLYDDWVYGNTWNGCYTGTAGTDVPTVESRSASQGSTNQFINCTGMNFLGEYLDSMPTVINLRPNSDGAGVVVPLGG